ncbi:hypothetical protein [Clostridium pasteurianum]|nr:hypothetical protein [Clostridium pasteurianum]
MKEKQFNIALRKPGKYKISFVFTWFLIVKCSENVHGKLVL